ncbi:MAG: hypothetical protein EX271_04490 [Acidimicrobiales bacterium]|nr:hypothetical protein [Hyphomonadaceae bacterium]RZV43111.1 MAG: hypothetical protein EX271_04490 [Acidimicrobiales bacterium]
MNKAFLSDVTAFVDRLKTESKKFAGDSSFERFMKGLSDGSVSFRWRLGGRIVPADIESAEDKDNMPLRYAMSAPIIYAMIIPILILDVTVSLYQAICFRLWNVPQVQRSKFIVVDRQYLSYLKPHQKFNCAYCGYAIGVLNYARRIGAVTERYWCPLKHKSELETAHDYYIEFAEYGDEADWHARRAEPID